MSMRPISEAKNPDLRASVAAMQRAARLAREIAIKTNTCLVISRDGPTVRIPPEVLREELAKQAASTK
ncbi:MAG: hypothetical protein CMK02_09720 [Polycyclovorans sp.]|nr:hypothetical protein [Polycyclovorans sp.]|tara:strand:+ start:993 stop:1196 length:204 start_codon:yes stop_codon:yes gene_type:complete